MNAMLDFYQNIVGVPIIDREMPTNLYLAVIIPTMIIVFLSGTFPAWKASKLQPLEVLSGQNNVKVGSNILRKMTAWMPTTLGLSVRSSLRRPIRLGMTFLAVGISLMLFGSIQMMSAGIEKSLISGLEDDQEWDVQVYVAFDDESTVLQWAANYSANTELIIEAPFGGVNDADNINRIFSVVGIDDYDDGMRRVNLIEGNLPEQNSQELLKF